MDTNTTSPTPDGRCHGIVHHGISRHRCGTRLRAGATLCVRHGGGPSPTGTIARRAARALLAKHGGQS